MTIEAYVREKQIALSYEIAARKKVYLDLNFWIMARDAVASVRLDTPAQDLLQCLRRGVAQRKILCPISDSIFTELMKQPLSEDRRIGTARLVDELSLGVSMIPSDRRVATEIAVFFYTLLGDAKTLHPMQDLVWTRVCHVLGETYPVLADLDGATQLQLQKSFVDRLWDSSLTQIVELIGGRWDPTDDHTDLAIDTNRKRDQHASEITSFVRAYEIEIAGAVDAAGVLATEVLCEVGEGRGVSPPRRGSEAWLAAQKFCKNALLHAFLEGGARNLVRTLHIEASLHAAMRVDKARRFKANDFYDFRHASAALGYCNVFLTERPLHDLIARKQFSFERINGCKVVSSLDESAALLHSLIV